MTDSVTQKGELMNILITPVALAAPQWVVDLLSGGSIYTIAQELWNFVMGIAFTLMGKNVNSFTTPVANAFAQLLGLDEIGRASCRERV